MNAALSLEPVVAWFRHQLGVGLPTFRVLLKHYTDNYWQEAHPCLPRHGCWHDICLTNFNEPRARVNTVQSSLFCRLPRVASSFLNKCSRADVFNDTFHAFKRAVIRYVNELWLAMWWPTNLSVYPTLPISGVFPVGDWMNKLKLNWIICSNYERYLEIKNKNNELLNNTSLWNGNFDGKWWCAVAG